MPLHRYVSAEEDSARWDGFPFRQGDVVVSTRSKHGTTWVQAIVLLLIHRTPTLPAPLAELSPWLDHLVEPRDAVIQRLETQRHRRVVKTHTPLDGVPADPRAFYVVVARHPLDAAVSLYHQGDNINRERLRQLTGAPSAPSRRRPTPAEWLRTWIDTPADPRDELDSLPGVMWHLSDAWSRRDQANVILVHFDDLLADLDGGMRGLAASLQIDVPTSRWRELVVAASFQGMRARAEAFVPDAVAVLRDAKAFFRRGSSGAGREVLDAEGLRRYHERVAELAPADLLAWLHRP